MAIALLEMPYQVAKLDLTDEKLMQQVKIEISKGNIKVEKKLVHYRFSLSRFCGLDFSNYEECGEFCGNLVKNGYVDIFYDHYDGPADSIGWSYRITKVDDNLKAVSREVESTDDFGRGTSCYLVVKDNILSILFKFKNNYYFCHRDKTLVTAFGAINGDDTSFRKMLAGLNYNSDTIMNKLSWFEIYQILSEE